MRRHDLRQKCSPDLRADFVDGPASVWFQVTAHVRIAIGRFGIPLIAVHQISLRLSGRERYV